MILPSMSCQCVCECACTDAQQPVSVYGVCVCVCVCCVCHSTLCNAANPCLGEIRSLIRQPQGLHSVITLNPPPSATTQHHFTLWDLRLDVTRQRERVCARVCVCVRACVCVFGVNAGKGSCLRVAEKSVGMLRHIQTSKNHKHT